MLDGIIISDLGGNTFSLSSTMRLHLNNKIALIQNIKTHLNLSNSCTQTFEKNNYQNWQCAPKLNGIALFSYLKSKGYNTHIIDSFLEEIDVFKKLLKKNPKFIIISTTFITDKTSLIRLAKEIRSLSPSSFIIAGGPFVYSSYLLYEKIKCKDYDTSSPRNDYLFLSNESIPYIDLFIVDKSGEIALSDALTAIKNGIPLHEIKNAAHWNGNSFAFTDRHEFEKPHIKIAWDKLPDHFFKRGVMNIQASTGCPYRCEFCNFVKDRSLTYIKPLNELVEELKFLETKGIKYVRFVDDNFRLGKDDLNHVCQTFINNRIQIKWMSFIRASTLARTDLKLLKKAGCIEAQMGIESADRNILKKMSKEADPELYQKVIKGLLNVGINCSCCFIIGFPGETSDTVKKTIDFINNIQDDSQEGIFSWSIYPFILAPLSPIYNKEKRNKYNLEGYLGNWKHSTMTSKEARQHIIEAFIAIDKASPIYSGDNLDMLYQLSPKKRKEFMMARHRLSKMFLNKDPDENLLNETFSPILCKE